MTISHPSFDGWRLLGTYPDGAANDVGSWLLHHGGEAMLLEVPPGLPVRRVRDELAVLGCALRYVTVSHGHGDHYDRTAWSQLRRAYPAAEFVEPPVVRTDAAGRSETWSLGGEPVWRLTAPKHSWGDTVTVFRGVAMTGDIELGMIGSVNREVPPAVREASMRYLADFPRRAGYRVHSIVSAHVNDLRTDVDWPGLFAW